MRRLKHEPTRRQLAGEGHAYHNIHTEHHKARGSVLRLPVRETLGTAAFQTAEAPAQPLFSGSLALLEPAVEQEAAPRPAATRRRILVVEDDARVAGALRHTLELDGDPAWDVEVAGEGIRALELAAQCPPDLVLLDVWLPGLDGGEVYRRLRANSTAGHTRVLFLTAGTSLDLYQHGIDDGVLLRKPFDVQELIGIVRAMLAD
jgi:CheY-like chemotaxis protein